MNDWRIGMTPNPLAQAGILAHLGKKFFAANKLTGYTFYGHITYFLIYKNQTASEEELKCVKQSQ